MPFWFGRKSDASNQPAAGAEAALSLRDRQIATLLADHPGTRVLDTSRTSFDVPLPVRGSPTAVPTLRVVLPADFPERAPRLCVFPRGAEHPRIRASDGTVVTPLLGTWKPHDHLGRVVADAKRLLTVEPPVWKHRTDGAHAVTATEVPQVSRVHAMEEKVAGPREEEVNSMLPPLPREFPGLATFTEVELDRIAADPDAVSALVASTEYAAAADRVIDSLRSECMRIARANFGEHAELRAMESGIKATREKCDALQKRVTSLSRQQEAVMKRFSPSAVGSKLARAAARVDRRTAQMEADLASGKMDPQAFVREYRQARAQRHRYLGLRDCLARRYPNVSMSS